MCIRDRSSGGSKPIECALVSANLPCVDLCTLPCTQNEQLFTISQSAEEIRKLVKDKAYVDTRKADGSTPLIVHSAANNREVVQELIEWKANVDLQDNHGWSALMVASQNDILRSLNVFYLLGPFLTSRMKK